MHRSRTRAWLQVRRRVSSLRCSPSARDGLAAHPKPALRRARATSTLSLSLCRSWNGTDQASRTNAIDDASSNAQGNPPGCYLARWRTGWTTLRFNVDGNNTGKCDSYDRCLCRTVRLSAEAPPSDAVPAAPPPPPTAAAPPAVLDPQYPIGSLADCSAAQCCVVIYTGSAHCVPVPIWDMQAWQHPGGSFVQASSICGTVRIAWLGRSTSHGSCDSTTSCDPEAMGQPTLQGWGSTHATRVGTYLPAECTPPQGTTPPPPTDGSAAAPSALEFTVCAVTEGVGGLVELVPRGAACVRNAPALESLSNPPIRSGAAGRAQATPAPGAALRFALPASHAPLSNPLGGHLSAWQPTRLGRVLVE